MQIHRAHKIELIVNESQELYLKKAVGCARFAETEPIQYSAQA